MKKILLLVLVFIKLAFSYSFMDMSQYDNSMSDSSLSDWDSGLYGKPICIPIPSNMSLCNNINYNQMKIPNLLSHDTIEEVVYQSSVWMPLLSVNCHKDTQLFLCSMFAPVCVEHSTIYPCRSLCESVKQSCEGPMLSYNYPWPSMFNCSRFPEDNGLCIPPSNKIPSTTEQTSTTTTTTTTSSIPSTFISTSLSTTSRTKNFIPSSTLTNKIKLGKAKTDKNPKKEDLILDDQTCFGCDEDNLNLEQIVYGYCKSDLVLRGRIQTIKISRLDLTNLRPKEKILFNRMNRTKSLFIKVSKRDRKLIKGGKLISPGALSSYLNENSELDDQYDDNYSNKDLNIYLLSNVHLKLSGNDANRGVLSRDPTLKHSNKKTRNLSNESNKRLNMNQNRKRFTNSNHCVCEKLRKGARKINTKYLIMANILKSKNIQISTRFKRDISNLNSSNDNSNEQQQQQQNKFKKSINQKRDDSFNQSKIIYLTNAVQWNKARAFIDYLEDGSIDKTNMCRNIKKTVNQINRAQNSLF